MGAGGSFVTSDTALGEGKKKEKKRAETCTAHKTPLSSASSVASELISWSCCPAYFLLSGWQISIFLDRARDGFARWLCRNQALLDFRKIPSSLAVAVNAVVGRTLFLLGATLFAEKTT